MKEYGYCLLHNKPVGKGKAIEKCRALKPFSSGLPYQMTRKNQNNYRCRHLIILNDEVIK